MNDADELARRYFALWTDYLTALVSDPRAAELLQRWVAFTTQFVSQVPGTPGKRAGKPYAAWPPIPPASGSTDGSPVAAAAAAGAPRERDDAVGELARRVGELERRLAALEQRPQARRPRPGNRASRE